MLTGVYPEEKQTCNFMTGGKVLVEARHPWNVGLYPPTDSGKDSGSDIPECLHFKEKALKSLRKLFSGGRFTSQRAEKAFIVVSFLK